MNHADKTITIYIDKLSPFSRQLENDLQNAGVVSVIKRVDEDKESVAEMYHLTKAIHTPVIRIKTEKEDVILVGYSPENKKKIEQLLHISLSTGKVTKSE